MAKGERRPVPDSYVRLEGSERHPVPKARLIGPVDPKERFSVTIVIRRRPDGDPMPDFDHFLKTPPSLRERLSEEEFARKYGASTEDMKRITDFAIRNDLKVEQTHSARRSVIVSGTAEQMGRAFGVTLDKYEHEVIRRRGQKPTTETFRGREGFIHIPADLVAIIVGVFGLDNRRIAKHNGADPPNTTTLSPPIQRPARR